MGKRKKFNIDSRVLAVFDGEEYEGVIVELHGKSKAVVLFDDGETIKIKINDLELIDFDERKYKKETKKDKQTSPNIGFNQHNIKWDGNHVNFRFKAEGAEFHGWWRKTAMGEIPVYAIDLYVSVDNKQYNVECMNYHENDPREDAYSLDSDICAAANKWFYYKCGGDLDSVKDLQLRADKPMIRIKRLETIDSLIVRLKEFRQTAIRCGGQRTIILNGDDEENDPSGGMRIQINLTSQALLLEGRIPPIMGGMALDHATLPKKEQQAARKAKQTPVDQGSIDELTDRLKASTDKREKRKIRATLRKLGHAGGARGQ